MSALGTSLHSARWRDGELRRILVLKTDHLGDFLLCLPAVRDLLRANPDATAEFVVGGPTRPLAERVPWIAKVHAWDSPRYARSGRASSDEELVALVRGGYDLIVDLTNDPSCAATALRRPSRWRRDLGSYRMKEKVKRLLGAGEGLRSTHVSRVAYRALGLAPPDEIVPEPLVLGSGEKERASELLSRGWPGDRPLAALHAGATWKHRRWPAARFSDLARGLEEHGFSVVLVGGPNDREISHEIVAAAGLASPRNLAGECDLPVTAAVLERSAVVVANDGGPAHLAAGQGTPVVVIFGPTDPVCFAPLGPHVRVLYSRRDCAPCGQQHCIWGRARCLEPIETKDVLAAAIESARSATRSPR